MKGLIVLDESYIDPAIVCLTSFFKYNDIPVVAYVKKGGDYSRLDFPKLEIKEIEFPELDTSKILLCKIQPKAMPACLARLKALQEECHEDTSILNFDLDTLFLGKIEIEPDKKGIYGSIEDAHKIWMNNPCYTDVVKTNKYFNTGLILYHHVDLSNLWDSFLEFFNGPDGIYLYCTEQDYINLYFKDDEKYVISNKYHKLWTMVHYCAQPTVMVHFYDVIKPWLMDTYGIYTKFNTYYFKKYFEAAFPLKEKLSTKFFNIIFHNNHLIFKS